jgi:hypothetical protein
MRANDNYPLGSNLYGLQARGALDRWTLPKRETLLNNSLAANQARG